jgi:hypothetical protein
MDRIAFTVSEFVMDISERAFDMNLAQKIANLICINIALFVKGALDGLPLHDLHVQNLAVTDSACTRAVIIDWNGNECEASKNAYQRVRQAVTSFLKWLPGLHTWDMAGDRAYLNGLDAIAYDNVQTWRPFLTDAARLTEAWRAQHQASDVQRRTLNFCATGLATAGRCRLAYDASDM